MAFFGQNYALTPLKKCDFLDFDKFYFQGQKGFFFSAKSESIISRLILIKFWPKAWVNPFEKNAIFWT